MKQWMENWEHVDLYTTPTGQRTGLYGRKTLLVFSWKKFWKQLRGSVAQWVARLTRNEEVVGSRPIKAPVFPWARNFTLIA